MKAHRLASYFPIMEDEKFEKFKEDIKENGQIEPIITFQGEILDGLNRYKACQQLGIEPQFTEYKGADPLHYVISVNVHRRHLDNGQLSMIANEMLPEFEAQAKERMGGKVSPPAGGEHELKLDSHGYASASKQVAEVFGVSSRSVDRAKRIKTVAPEKVDFIISGKETLNYVDNELRIKAAKERQSIQQEKENEKIHQKRSQAVSDYYEATKRFKGDIELAIISAERGGFDPSGKNFLLNKNDSIRELMQKLEDLL